MIIFAYIGRIYTPGSTYSFTFYALCLFSIILVHFFLFFSLALLHKVLLFIFHVTIM